MDWAPSGGKGALLQGGREAETGAPGREKQTDYITDLKNKIKKINLKVFQAKAWKCHMRYGQVFVKFFGLVT